mgnify:CR=1 FL=1
MVNIVITGDAIETGIYRTAVADLVMAALKDGDSLYTVGRSSIEEAVREMAVAYNAPVPVPALMPMTYDASQAVQRLSHPTITRVLFIHNDPMGSAMGRLLAQTPMVLGKTEYVVPEIRYAALA